MALTNAHHEGKVYFSWEHLVDAMTAIESGTAIGVRYVEEETRAVAIHEAGHAAAAHIYRPGLESSRLSIRMRGGSLGHHQAFQKEERFSEWHSEAMGGLIHTLGAMAAEIVFYGENGNGVGGDLQSATWDAGYMVGAAGMGPRRVALNGPKTRGETEDETRERIEKRLQQIGNKIMNRTQVGGLTGNPVASVLGDRYKREFVAQIMGEAFVVAYNFIAANKDKVEHVANTLIEKQEIFGDDLGRLLDAQRFTRPEIDWTKDETWPQI
jgi:cell division protease FtsH